MTQAARRALARRAPAAARSLLLCDGDLGECAAELGAARRRRRRGRLRARRCSVRTARRRRVRDRARVRALGDPARAAASRRAPISGQRALDRATLERVLPFAHGFGMEVGMTIDAVRGGARVSEVALALSHRATGRTPPGLLHRGRQLLDFARAYARRGE